MKVKLSDNGLFIQIVDASRIEIEQLKISFTKKVENWFIMKKKNPNWNCEISFYDKYLNIPFGLWKELFTMCRDYGFTVEFINNIPFTDSTFDVNDFNDWITEYFCHENSTMQPRDYQQKAVECALTYKYCTEEISTSGGKTFVSYMFFQYLFEREKIKRLLYIVPNVGLVLQGEGDFYEYMDKSGHTRPKWTTQCIYSDGDNTDIPHGSVVFGTYQSLSKKPIEFFESVDAIICDECHHSSNASIRKVISMCYNAKYKIGLTGTLPKNGTCNSFTIQSYLGPNVYKITSEQLINQGHATPVEVKCFDMDYLDIDLKRKLLELREHKDKDGNKLLNLEKEIMRDNRNRLLFLCTTIAKSDKNSLVLFSDVKGEYGRNIYNWLRANTDNRTIYYIDGGTSSDNREFIKSEMEKNDDIILVASIGTFSEGISIKNLHYIYLAECGKSEIISAQILGRGMRLLNNKDKVIVVDFVDNYCYGNNPYQKHNYLYRHGLERQEIYKNRKFPFVVEKVTI